MNKIFTFRVLLDYEEDVFRDIQIKSSASFDIFHKLILDAFGFDNSQMASFYMSNEHWDKGEEITLIDMGITEQPIKLMKNSRIEQLIQKTGNRMIYVYDFMLMWCFFVECVGTEEVDSYDEFENAIVFKHGEAPPQTSKGTNFNFESDFIGEEEDEDNPFGDFYGDDEDEDAYDKYY